MTKNSMTDPAHIWLKDRSNIHGYFVSIQRDSLEWYDSGTVQHDFRRAAPLESVLSVSIREVDEMRTFWAGLKGFAIGGFAGCGIEFVASTANAYGTTQTPPKWNWAVPIGGALAGAAIGAYIGSSADPHDYVDVWKLREIDSTHK